MGSSKADTSDIEDAIEVDVDDAPDGSDQNDALDETLETEEEFSEPEVEEAAYEEEYEVVEDRSPSMASRLLTWLVLLIAGGGLALWGAPKVAPNLPEWAAPAAKFLMPGTSSAEKAIAELRESAQSEIEALRGEIDARFAEASNREELAGIVSAEVGKVEESVGAELTSLKDQMAAIDGTEIETRLATLETRFEGVSAEVASINQSLQDAITSGGSISEEALAQITSKSAEIEGLKAELGQISALVGGVTQRIDDVEAAADRRVDEATAQAQAAAEQAALLERTTEFKAALSALQSAAANGSPFETELAAIAAMDNIEPAPVLFEVAPQGVQSQKTLQTEFKDLSHEAIRASIKAEADNGTMSRVGAFFQSQVATRSLEPLEGDGADAVLSRIDAALAGDNLDTLLGEASSLTEATRAPLAEWLEKIELRKTVLDAISALDTQPS